MPCLFDIPGRPALLSSFRNGRRADGGRECVGVTERREGKGNCCWDITYEKKINLKCQFIN